jgi:PTH1 family peptidyl-tRNA hydrolase
MQLIVGLGNPGERYERTRHNVGFLVLEKLKTKISNFQFPISKWFDTTHHPESVEGQILNRNFQLEKKFNAEIQKLEDVILAKPQTFMNESGMAVSSLANFYKIKPDNIYVIHDDLDLRLGDYKIQKGVGPKLHYGIQSIEEKLGSKDFWRIRVGVDNRDPQNRIPGEEYVLQKFTDEEKGIIERTIDKVIIELNSVIKFK